MFSRFSFSDRRARRAVLLMALLLVATTGLTIDGLRSDADRMPLSHQYSAPSATAMPATAETPLGARRLAGYYPAIPVRVIDGDTVEMRVSVWLGQDVTTRVRLRDIDAPELRARCQDERVKAEAAKARLETLLSSSGYFLTDVGYDKYGTRVVARIVDSTYADLGIRLLEEKLARAYRGGKRQGWCADALAIPAGLPG